MREGSFRDKLYKHFFFTGLLAATTLPALGHGLTGLDPLALPLFSVSSLNEWVDC
jgi:hypothetical protein